MTFGDLVSGLLSQYLAINHLSEGRWGDAMGEANKMAMREKFIEIMIAVD
jgi:hypothetical protein